MVLFPVLALGAPETRWVIENGRAAPEKYYDEKPAFLEQTYDLTSEGTTSLHFRTEAQPGRVLLTKFQWPDAKDFSLIAANGVIGFDLWINDASKIGSPAEVMGNVFEFTIGSRSNDKFASWYIPSGLLVSGKWNAVRLVLRDGLPQLNNSSVNDVSLSKVKGAIVTGGADTDWKQVNYDRWNFPSYGSAEMYLDNCVAQSIDDAQLPKNVATFSRQELPPMPSNPKDEDILPPDVRKDAFFNKPDVDFNRIEGWTATIYDGDGQFYLSPRQGIRGIPNARIEAKCTGNNGRIVIAPPKPLRIDHAFDTVEAWVHGHYHYGLSLTVNFRDSTGQAYSIRGGDTTYWHGGMIFCNWTLYRNRDSSRLIPAGAELVSLEIGPLAKDQAYLFTLDEMRFVKFDLSGPAPKYEHVGPMVKLPVTDSGAAPVTKSKVTTSASQKENAFILEYRVPEQKGGRTYESYGKTIAESWTTPEQTVRYIIEPKMGTFSDISVEVGASGRFRPAVESGPILIYGTTIVDPVRDGGVKRTCLGSKLEGDKLRTSWKFESPAGVTVVRYTFYLMGKALAIEAESDSATVQQWLFGHADGLLAPKVIESPYMRLHANFLFDRGVFVSYLPDWYFSNVSTLPYFGENKVEAGKAWYGFADSSRYEYLPRTDGSRFPLKERFYIAVSSDFDEVLPTVNNPPSPNKAILKKFLWQIAGNGGKDLPSIKQYVQQAVDYGMTHIYFIWHAGFWSDRGGRGPEPFIGRMHNSETFSQYGGDDAAIAFYQWMREKGIRTGYYEGYNFIEPICDYYLYDWMAFEPDGNWRPTWVQAYRCKPWAFAEYCATTSRERQKKYGADVIYMDGWTANNAFASSDFDARYPEGGKMIDTLRAEACAYRNLREVIGGPVFSEGCGRHYREAGIVDGSYGQTYDVYRRQPTPLFVNFQLLKTHELGGDLGMGPCSGMFSEKAYPSPGEYYDFVCCELAFGNIGIQEPYFGLAPASQLMPMRFLTYFMVQQVQEQYVMEPVAEILYCDGNRMVDTNEALARDVQLESQTYVRYKNGLEIWANYNPAGKTWTVASDGVNYVLPKGGWLVKKGKELLEFSALIDGRRVDYSDGPNYTYAFAGEKEFNGCGLHVPAGKYWIKHKQGPLAGKELLYPPQ